MSDIDIRDRLEAAVRPAFTAPFHAADDLARGQAARRRRRVREVAVGASACAVASVAVVASLPLATGGGAAGGSSSEGGSASASTSPGPSRSSDPEAVAGRLRGAFVEHLRPAVKHGLVGMPIPNDVDPVTVAPKPLYHGTDQSALFLTIRDDVRKGDAPVPLLCANNAAYNRCERRTLDDGTEVVVGQGADDLLAVVWGRGGDLVDVHVHWSSAGESRDVTLDQLVELATDDRVWVPRFTSDAASRFMVVSPSTAGS
jgi:hypothetical protein